MVCNCVVVLLNNISYVCINNHVYFFLDIDDGNDIELETPVETPVESDSKEVGNMCSRIILTSKFHHY